MDKSIQELKAHAYDCVLAMEQLKHELQQIEKLIMQKQQEEKESKVEDKKKDK
jgi:hypothetical protein